MNIKAIIWDWNGTLLNDLDVSILSMNQMLAKRDYPLLTVEKYREIFTFPVRDYYKAAGVDFGQHEWDEVAMEFIGNFRKNVPDAAVFTEVVEVLNYLVQKKYRLFVLSAMQQDLLTETITDRLDMHMFERIVGLNNHYAHTKIESARILVDKIGLPKTEIVMVGDTIHDFEVADAAGIRCILFSAGHQSRHRLEKTGAIVIDSLAEIMELF